MFRSNRKGTFNLYQMRSNSPGSEELLLDFPSATPNDWSHDGRLLYSVDNGDLWSFSLGKTGAGTSTAFVNASYLELAGQFSPDGRWVAYVSNESERYEIYVRPFPGPGGQSLISTAGGITPRWRRDGTELYYIAPDSTLMAAPIGTKDDTLHVGVPVPLFRTHIRRGGRTHYLSHEYAVARDGRFLINVVVGDANVSPLTLLLNWKPKP